MIYVFQNKKIILRLIGKYIVKMLLTFNFLYYFRWMLISADIIISISFKVTHLLFFTDADPPKQIQIWNKSALVF